MPLTVLPTEAPHELCKAVLPTYTLEPPDILDLQGVRLVPNANYLLNSTDTVRITVQRTSLDQLMPGDVLSIRAPGAPTLAPIDGSFLIQNNGAVVLGGVYGAIEVVGESLQSARDKIQQKLQETLKVPDVNVSLIEATIPVQGEFTIGIEGKVAFGPVYGEVALAGLTLNAAKEKLKAHFDTIFRSPKVSIDLVQSSIQQQIVGEHLVGPDGNISLGIFGAISVVGLTLDEARLAIENTIANFFDKPMVGISVFSYNSRVYYVITEGAGLGDAVLRFPVTGNDTVLDALAQVNGLSRVSSTRMWIARPSPDNSFQVLPIDWKSVTSLAATKTNYQLLPGDRLYIAQDSLVAFDNRLAKLLGPLERVMGFSILGAETATRLSGQVLRGGGNPRLGGF